MAKKTTARPLEPVPRKANMVIRRNNRPRGAGAARGGPYGRSA